MRRAPVPSCHLTQCWLIAHRTLWTNQTIFPSNKSKVFRPVCDIVYCLYPWVVKCYVITELCSYTLSDTIVHVSGNYDQNMFINSPWSNVLVLGRNSSRWWPDSLRMPSPYMNQCWFIVKWAHMNHPKQMVSPCFQVHVLWWELWSINSRWPIIMALGQKLLQVLTCCLIGAKPLPELRVYIPWPLLNKIKRYVSQHIMISTLENAL